MKELESQLGKKDKEISEMKEKMLELSISDQSAKYNQVLVHEMNEKNQKLEAELK